jgi:hypothetical protein
VATKVPPAYVQSQPAAIRSRAARAAPVRVPALTGRSQWKRRLFWWWGAAPSGLAASITPSRPDVPQVLVNKHPETLPHPNAVGVMKRTAELFRLWGSRGGAVGESPRSGAPEEW